MAGAMDLSKGLPLRTIPRACERESEAIPLKAPTDHSLDIIVDKSGCTMRSERSERWGDSIGSGICFFTPCCPSHKGT